MAVGLLLAAGVPLAAGLVSIHVLGRRSYQKETGRLFQSISQYLAVSLRSDVDHQVALLRNWIETADLAAVIVQPDATVPRERLAEEDAALERRWPSLTDADPELRSRLENPAARLIRQFQAKHPRFAEIFVTDAKGRLASASNKTSDFIQSDESWWKEAMRLGDRHAWLEGISFDQSAEVYSVNIALRISGRGEGRPPAGVLKCVLDVSPLFGSFERILGATRPVREVVLEDGRVLVRFFDTSAAPLREHVDPRLMEIVRTRQRGWTTAPADSPQPSVAGFSRIVFKSETEDDSDASGLVPMYVVVHDTVSAVMAPVQRQLMLLSAAGGGVVLVFLLAGLYLADRRIVRPVRALREAAQGIAAQARLNDAEAASGVALAPQPGPEVTAARLDEVKRLQSDDEIGELTRDFLLMARRVLRYHEQLETELALRTEEVEKDLAIAREFQEALLPRSYPTVPSPPVSGPIMLDFYHVYKPATSVSGDLVHMIQLSDHEAGVFVADVMGHGARSALISAILRTLLQNAARENRDPGALLGCINRQFKDILPDRLDLIFATAFYAVFDTLAGCVRYAAAGHPSPLRLRRETGRVEAVIDSSKRHPALGLIGETAYRTSELPLMPGDVYLLYTDGVVESPNVRGEEFGVERLRGAMEQNAGRGGEAMANAVLAALHEFMDVVVTADDICLVTIGVRERHPDRAAQA